MFQRHRKLIEYLYLDLHLEVSIFPEEVEIVSCSEN